MNQKFRVELLEEVNNLQESVGDLNEYSSQLNQENKKQSQKLQDLEIILKRYRNLHKEIQIDVNDISKEMGDGVLVEYKKIDSIIEDMIRSFEQFNENF